MSATSRVRDPMTVEAFLAWAERAPGRWQLVDGSPQAMAPARPTHGAIQMELGRLIGNHLAGTPCRAVGEAGVIPRVLGRSNVRVPDLAVTCTPDAEDERALAGPLLLAEILSPGNESATWANVSTYTTIPSVREILILRSDRIGAELLPRRADGEWPVAPETILVGYIGLETIGLTLTLPAIYATTRFRA